MLPKNFKSMFGITEEADLKMADNIWKMLDDMSSNDPEAYEKFIQKNLSEGLQDAKQEKQKQDMPYKITPQEYMLLEMEAQLQEQTLAQQPDAELKQKLDLNINKDKWSDVRSKFSPRVRFFLNICHSERVKGATLKSKPGVSVNQFQVTMMNDIECLYYSVQGPEFEKQQLPNHQSAIYYYVMVFNSNFLKAFDAAPNGKRLFLGIAVAYFQERVKGDRNMILSKIDTRTLYGKNLYYEIEKQSIKISQNKFKYGKSTKAGPFLLEQQVDVRQRERNEKRKQKNEKKEDAVTDKKKAPISIHPKKEELQTTIVVPSSSNPVPKTPLIQVLDQKYNEVDSQDKILSYEMKENQNGYSISFLLPPQIASISQLDLEVSSNAIKLSVITEIQANQKKVEIKLDKLVDTENVKAKMKKKMHTLLVEVSFIK